MNNKLLIDNEALRARLKIRDFFLSYTVREIYQNIGQVLSAVRFELDVAQPDLGVIHSAEQLIGQAIRDLRRMTKHFDPDTALLAQGGFTETIRKATAILYPKNAPVVSGKERQDAVRQEVKFIAFGAFLRLLMWIKERQRECCSVMVTFSRRALNMALSFQGNWEDGNLSDKAEELVRVNKSIGLLDGACHAIEKRNGMTVCTLKIPLKKAI